MNRAAAILLLAALISPIAARGATFELPEIPAPLKPLLEARIFNANAIVASLPAHPLGEIFLDDFLQFLVAGMEREKVDVMVAHQLVCRDYGDEDLGIFAVDRYAARHGAEDGFLAWLVASHPDLRASCKAYSCLSALTGIPPTTTTGRVSVFARLHTAARQESAIDAARDTLRAWSEAVDAAQARFAGTQGRAMLGAWPLQALQPVLRFDPVPTALLHALADAMDTADAQQRLQGAAMPTGEPIFAAAVAVALFLIADEADEEPLRSADAATAPLPDEVRAYLTLPVAARLIQRLELDDAAARLDAASALDASGLQRENIAQLLSKCRAGVKL